MTYITVHVHLPHVEELTESSVISESSVSQGELQVEHWQCEGVKTKLDQGLHQHIQIVQRQDLKLNN